MTSPIDAIYQTIFGSSEKSGTALEKLAAIGSHLLKRGKVIHDDRVRGAHSGSVYQLDVHQMANGEKIFGEVKDYSQRAKPVGRSDLQKLGGALPDLTAIDRGEFWSVTGYTGPAIKYASASEKISGKPIELRNLQFEAIPDKAGIVMTVIIRGKLIIPLVDQAEWEADFTPESKEALKKLIPAGQSSLAICEKIEDIYHADGSTMASIFSLTSSGYADPQEDGVARGAYELPGGYVKVNGTLYEIERLKYRIPFSIEIMETVIGDDPNQPRSNYLMSIEDHNGDLLKRVSEQELKKYTFDTDGQIRKKP